MNRATQPAEKRSNVRSTSPMLRAADWELEYDLGRERASLAAKPRCGRRNAVSVPETLLLWLVFRLRLMAAGGQPPDRPAGPIDSRYADRWQNLSAYILLSAARTQNHGKRQAMCTATGRRLAASGKVKWG